MRLQLSIFVSLIVASLFFFVSCGRPIAVVKERHFTGPAQDRHVRHTFTISNGGSGILNIAGVIPGCGCAVASVDNTQLSSGEHAHIDVDLDLNKGRSSAEVSVFTNDSAARPLILTVSCNEPTPPCIIRFAPDVMRFATDDDTETICGKTQLILHCSSERDIGMGSLLLSSSDDNLRLLPDDTSQYVSTDSGSITTRVGPVSRQVRYEIVPGPHGYADSYMVTASCPDGDTIAKATFTILVDRE